MDDKFREEVYRKYDYFKNNKEDKFFYQHQYRKNRNMTAIINSFLLLIVTSSVMLVGGISAYAAFGGTISGKPVLEWIGIKFSDQYEEYRVGVEEKQEISYHETSVELTSTVCDEGYTVLEFDVKLSKEDREYLRLDESIITEQDLEEALQRDQNQYKGTGETSYYDILKKSEETKNTIQLGFFAKEPEAEEKKAYETEATYNVIIDGEKKWVKTTQTATKISDYEYKVYQLFLLTDDKIDHKKNFKIALSNIVLGNTGQKRKTESKMQIINTQNNRREIYIGGEFEVEVSKEKATENTQIVKPEKDKIEYKNMIKTIEEVKITPLQMIAKVDTQMKEVSLQSLSKGGLIDFVVYDEQGNELSSCQYEVKRSITYQNGKTEEWATGDIGTYIDFYHATMNLTEYIIIEKKENIEGLRIEAIERIDTSEGEKREKIGEWKITL